MDNGTLSFMIVDKIESRLFLFNADGTLVATTPVLLGLARGDDSPPEIGTRKLSAITPAERITPAGRFVVEAGKDLAGRDILWIDYDAAIALHRASDRSSNSGRKNRASLLSNPVVAARRISLGCINVSTAFYDGFIQPAFRRKKGVAYILPETRSLNAQFNIPEIKAAEWTAAGI
ncbi:L,D-transpeptidase [Polymorphobacter sp. PAMC 29334]|uniref:L,D-transpeptidase n=1 Tax=Polymorphobacter sp. PAMC 29334 TaxID=2862331 RepID=UPI001C78D3F3|nr:L,D-transpeptidase [Polymorphobacter sp. PAMC 29334]QYE33757.1 L,D-transpeptidase [Polymorphobacter sp. PAMC 29334]